jgi:hypothetical protein
VSLSRWDDQNRRVADSFPSPTWEQVESLLAFFDGGIQGEFSLDGEPERGISVGGGGSDFYLCAIGRNFGPYSLSTGKDRETMGQITLGGVATDLPVRYFASPQQVRKAVRHFFVTGELSPDLEWELD